MQYAFVWRCVETHLSGAVCEWKSLFSEHTAASDSPELCYWRVAVSLRKEDVHVREGGGQVCDLSAGSGWLVVTRVGVTTPCPLMSGSWWSAKQSRA